MPPHLARHPGLPAPRPHFLVLVCHRPQRIALPALVHPLFPLRVVRRSDRPVLDPATAKLLITQPGEITHEVAQVGDQVPVAAHQLVVPLAGVLLRPP
ncbi:MAG: hypothetical protein MZV70_19270 [Desulfobacterales bacterium]|nr:hypothetical protein [Desulfobacterales bacterium]